MKKYKYTKSFTYEGKRYFVRGNSIQEVIEKKAIKLRDLQEGKVIINSAMTVKEWSDICFHTYKTGITPESYEAIMQRVSKHILPVIGELSISAVKPVQCQQILNEQIGKSKSYITKIHQDLCFIFRKALENQLIIKDPSAFLERPAGGTRHRRTITDIERKHLLKVCTENSRFIPFLFMLYCGCRPAEALKIRANDIHMIDGVRALHIRGTKTRNADRYVPIPDELYEIIEPVNPGGFELFAKKQTGAEHTKSSYRTLTEALYREMNLSMGAKCYRNQIMPPYPLADDFTPYCLRHTYCTDLKKAGVPVTIAKDYMGHTDIATTANIYTHADTETFLQGAYILGLKSEKNRAEKSG